MRIWRCLQCGKEFTDKTFSHGVASHSPDCDGTCKRCPVEIECGPVEEIETDEGGRDVRE